MPDVCKTPKERDANTKKLRTGIGIKEIPNTARNQRIGFNSKGGVSSFKTRKKDDAFRRENFGF